MKLPPLNKEAIDRLIKLGKELNKKNVDVFDPDEVYGTKALREEVKRYMGKSSIDNKEPTRCNCDASCGENRYHDVGSPGCRFEDELAYEAYWAIKTPNWWAKEQVATLKPLGDIQNMTRPWGKWEVLATGKGFKVKKLEILVDKSISMQYHTHRSEHWTIIQGTGKVIVDGNIFTVKRGDTFFVPQLSIHKVSNTSLTETLIAVEVQMGDICEETDIVRV